MPVPHKMSAAERKRGADSETGCHLAVCPPSLSAHITSLPPDPALCTHSLAYSISAGLSPCWVLGRRPSYSNSCGSRPLSSLVVLGPPQLSATCQIQRRFDATALTETPASSLQVRWSALDCPDAASMQLHPQASRNLHKPQVLQCIRSAAVAPVQMMIHDDSAALAAELERDGGRCAREAGYVGIRVRTHGQTPFDQAGTRRDNPIPDTVQESANRCERKMISLYGNPSTV